MTSSSTNNSQASMRATMRAGNTSSEQSATPVPTPVTSNNSRASETITVSASSASFTTSAVPHDSPTPANSEGGSLHALRDLAQWSSDPNSFWDQPAPLRLTQPIYRERFRVFLAQALKEGAELYNQIMLTQPADIQAIRSFRMQTRRVMPQFQMQIYRYRFTCVMAYQFWMHATRDIPTTRLYKLTSSHIREFQCLAGLSPDNERACFNVLFGGGRRHEFCQKLQPDQEDVDYGPLFESDIPDAMYGLFFFLLLIITQAGDCAKATFVIDGISKQTKPEPIAENM